MESTIQIQAAVFSELFSLAEDIVTLKPDQLYKCSNCAACPDVHKSAYLQEGAFHFVGRFGFNQEYRCYVCPDHQHGIACHHKLAPVLTHALTKCNAVQ